MVVTMAFGCEKCGLILIPAVIWFWETTQVELWPEKYGVQYCEPAAAVACTAAALTLGKKK